MNSSNQNQVSVQTFIVPYSSLNQNSINEYTIYTKLSNTSIAKSLPKNAMIFTELQDHYQLFITDSDNNIKPVRYVSSENLISLRKNLKEESDKIFVTLKSELSNDLDDTLSSLQRYSYTFKTELSNTEKRINDVFVNIETKLSNLSGYEGSTIQLESELNSLKTNVNSLSNNYSNSYVYMNNVFDTINTTLTSYISYISNLQEKVQTLETKLNEYEQNQNNDNQNNDNQNNDDIDIMPILNDILDLKRNYRSLNSNFSDLNDRVNELRTNFSNLLSYLHIPFSYINTNTEDTNTEDTN